MRTTVLARRLAPLAVAAGLTLVPGAATALPPGGASSDTPGTSASVSPTSLAPCGTLSFTLSGFPAGETVSVKIDDGGSATGQGAGVVHTQVISPSGTVNGSFEVPCDIAAGPHWLRFLASAPAPGGNGTVGYSHAGGTDFTIAGGQSSSGGGSTSGGSNTGGSNTGGSSPGGSNDGGAAGQGDSSYGDPASGDDAAPQEDGGSAGEASEESAQVAQAGETLEVPKPKPAQRTDAAASTDGTNASAGGTGATGTTPVAALEPSEQEGPPWVGIVGAAVLVGAAAAFCAIAVRKRGAGAHPPA